jgi:TonB dependent receptor
MNGQPILGAPNIVISGFDQVGITPPEGRNDITGHLTDIVSYATGKHQLRFGGEVRQGRVDEFYFRRSLGKFAFDGTQGPWAGTCPVANVLCADRLALADFLAGDVSTSSIAVGDAERRILVNSFSFFGQDAWHAKQRLTLNVGLRYEYGGPLHNGDRDLAVFVPGKGLVIQGTGIDAIFPPDRNNFAPRFGFSYQPRAEGDLVVRGGIGVFYEQTAISPFLDNRPPNAAANGLENNPTGPHAVDNYSRNAYNWQTVQQGGQSIFPGAVTCASLNHTVESGCGIPNPVTGANIYNVFSVGQNFRTPYYFNYDLQLEKGIGNVAVLQIGYVGSQGRKLTVTENINQNGTFNFQYPNVGSINQFDSAVTSNYNSLQTVLRLQSWQGFTAQFAYTWAHALDEATEFRAVIPLDSFNLKQEYGSSDFDTRHNLTAYWTYEVPGSSRGPKIATHGWQLSGLLSFHSGQPFNFPGTGVSGNQRPGLNVVGNPFSVFCTLSTRLAVSSGSTQPRSVHLRRHAYRTVPMATSRGISLMGPALVTWIFLSSKISRLLRASNYNFARKCLTSSTGSTSRQVADLWDLAGLLPIPSAISSAVQASDQASRSTRSLLERSFSSGSACLDFSGDLKGPLPTPHSPPVQVHCSPIPIVARFPCRGGPSTMSKQSDLRGKTSAYSRDSQERVYRSTLK